jgi:hypothetical protein
MAHSLSSKAGPQDMTLLDVLPMAIGINKVDGTMHVLFAKNQPLPDYKTRTLTTSKDEPALDHAPDLPGRVEVREGERAPRHLRVLGLREAPQGAGQDRGHLPHRLGGHPQPHGALFPGNVGAAARAMANTGVDELVLVDPPAFDMERARWMATGGVPLLERAPFCR